MSGASDDRDLNGPDQLDPFDPPADLDPPSKNWLFDERNPHRLKGLWIDGGEQEIVKLMRQQRELAAQQAETARQQAATAQRQAETVQQQRETIEQLAGLNLLVQLLPAVSDKKTRNQAAATTFARYMREAMIEHGYTREQIEPVIISVVSKMLKVTATPDAARMFLKRLGVQD